MRNYSNYKKHTNDKDRKFIYLHLLDNPKKTIKELIIECNYLSSDPYLRCELEIMLERKLINFENEVYTANEDINFLCWALIPEMSFTSALKFSKEEAYTKIRDEAIRIHRTKKELT